MFLFLHRRLRRSPSTSCCFFSFFSFIFSVFIDNFLPFRLAPILPLLPIVSITETFSFFHSLFCHWFFYFALVCTPLGTNSVAQTDGSKHSKRLSLWRPFHFLFLLRRNDAEWRLEKVKVTESAARVLRKRPHNSRPSRKKIETKRASD